jgi:hypothetical protein
MVCGDGDDNNDGAVDGDGGVNVPERDVGADRDDESPRY